MAGKADIIDDIANTAGLTRRQATEAFQATVDSITGYLRKGERVQIPGFGSFSVSERAARTGRNPATGESIKIKASKNVRFKGGREMKDALNAGGGRKAKK
jgi:DNA-binding protein HU-beta